MTTIESKPQRKRYITKKPCPQQYGLAVLSNIRAGKKKKTPIQKELDELDKFNGVR
jgi:hypothetical protein